VRRIRASIVVGLACLPLLGAAASGQAHDDPVSLVSAERSFADAAAAEGMRDAFLSVLADDGVLFRPLPVDGRRWFLDRPPPPGLLAWKPVHGAVSRAGDLGYTSGPWRYTAPGTPDAFGHYVSIWRRGTNGAWELVLDLGVRHRKSGEGGRRPRIDRGGSPVQDRYHHGRDTLRHRLLATDRRLSATLSEGGRSDRLGAVLDPRVRLLRNGRLPLRGRAEVARFLRRQAPRQPARVQAGAVALSGDLGYTYGSVTPSAGTAGWGYARIWRFEPGRGWTLLLDIELAPAS
jgi:ketosteroid isomerase-like protein